MQGEAVHLLLWDFCPRKMSNGFIAGICKEMWWINCPFHWRSLSGVFQLLNMPCDDCTLLQLIACGREEGTVTLGS